MYAWVLQYHGSKNDLLISFKARISKEECLIISFDERLFRIVQIKKNPGNLSVLTETEHNETEAISVWFKCQYDSEF